MKPFELTYLSLMGFLPPLQRTIRERLLEIARGHDQPPEILDVGGRKSHYTIGVPARITLSDLPRESEVQKDLNLGITGNIIEKTQARRSNIERIVLDDMTQSKFPDASFDCVVAVEVLEHVAEDAAFVENVRRVLRPGGVFLMSTPNGDCVPNHNADHKRHYKREDLRSLLASNFESVDVIYAIAGTRFRSWGLKSWSPRHPLRTMQSMVGNVINGWESAAPELRQQANGPRHLIACARRASAASTADAPQQEILRKVG